MPSVVDSLLVNLINMSNGEVEESWAPEVVNMGEEDPELDMEVEENFELSGNYGGARIRLLSQRSIKEELVDGDSSEYEEITVEVDGDFFLKEEDSFEREEITYQVTILGFASTPSGNSFFLLQGKIIKIALLHMLTHLTPAEDQQRQ